MDLLETIVFGLRIILAPVHELGHVVFGWISFNPTWFGSWNHVYVTREEWFVSLGGMVFEILAVFLVAHFVGKKTKYIYTWTIAYTLVILIAIGFQSDKDGYGPIMPAIWYILGTASLVWQVVFLYRGLRWPETEKSDKQVHRQTRQGKGGLISLLMALPSPEDWIRQVARRKARNQTTGSCSKSSTTTKG